MRLDQVLISRGFIKTVEHGWVNLNCVKSVKQYESILYLKLNDGTTLYGGVINCIDDEGKELDEAFTDKGNP